MLKPFSNISFSINEIACKNWNYSENNWMQNLETEIVEIEKNYIKSKTKLFGKFAVF